MLLHLGGGLGQWNCVCGECGDKLKERGDRCPICREPIDAVIKNYI